VAPHRLPAVFGSVNEGCPRLRVAGIPKACQQTKQVRKSFLIPALARGSLLMEAPHEQAQPDLV
jgi:hypothetical protein